MAGTTHLYLDARSDPVVSRTIYSILLASSAARTKVQPLLIIWTRHAVFGKLPHPALINVRIVWRRSVVQEKVDIIEHESMKTVTPRN